MHFDNSISIPFTTWLSYNKPDGFHVIFMPVTVEFSRCISTCSSAMFEFKYKYLMIGSATILYLKHIKNENNDMLKIIKGTFILLCILSFSISLNTTTTFASINNFYVDESIYGQTFSDWNLSTAYKQGDLVLFCDKVYCATEKMTGIIPGTDSRWVCKADLGYLNTLDVSNKCELTANTTDSNTKITVQILVLRYEGVATRSNYTFTVYSKIPSFTPWDAAVLSYIHYDDGERTINKIDTFGHTILKPDVLRKVSYSFHHIKKVQAVITGRYNGQELTPTGCFMEPPIM